MSSNNNENVHPLFSLFHNIKIMHNIYQHFLLIIKILVEWEFSAAVFSLKPLCWNVNDDLNVNSDKEYLLVEFIWIFNLIQVIQFVNDNNNMLDLIFEDTDLSILH